MELSYLVSLATSRIKKKVIQHPNTGNWRETTMQLQLPVDVYISRLLFAWPLSILIVFLEQIFFVTFIALLFLIVANTIFHNNPTYSEPNFSLTKSALAIVEES